MKVKSEKYWVPWVIFCGMGLILAVVLSSIIRVLDWHLQENYVQVLDVLLGIFIICGLGLMVVEKSRYIGLLIVAIAIPSLLYFTILPPVKIMAEFLGIGICIGAAITGFCIYKIHFDWLAKIVKYLIDIFVIIVIGYTVSKMIEDSTIIMNMGYLPYFIVAIITIIGLWFFFTKNLFAITSSDVFVFGPTGSGKSVFIAALGMEIAKSQGFSKSYIFSQNPDAPSRLTVNAMAHRLAQGQVPEGNRSNEMAYYEFPAKKWGIIPLIVTSLDYAGALVERENIDKISKINYNAEIQYFSQVLNRSPSDLKMEFGNIQFLVDFKNNHTEDFYNNFDLIVPAFAYARLLKAGKIIFLLDGSKLHSLITDDENWISYIDGIGRLIDELGDDKDYAFAVTKADLIPSMTKKESSTGEKFSPENQEASIGDMVRTYPADSKEATQLEKEYFEHLLRSNLAFTNIFNRIMSEQFIKTKYVEGFMISVDASKRGGRPGIEGYNPWRMKKIIEYVFKF
jgi:hypothetical protein